MFKENAIKLIKEIADCKWDIIYNTGCANPGNNGPYHHKDSPARNTAHWLIIYCYLYKITKEKKYINISEKLASYLIFEHEKTVSGAVECMLTDEYNHLNGLMGQAWIVEALLYYYDITKDEKVYKAARSIYLVQKYNDKIHLWDMIEVDGSNLGYDCVFNHQLWYAAVGSLFIRYQEDEIIKQINDFLTHCSHHMRVHNNGLIVHYGSLKKIRFRRKVKISIIRTLNKTVLNKRRFIDPNKYDPDAHERGYHYFNLYAFAILFQTMPEHTIFKDSKLVKALEYGKRIKEHNDAYNVYRIREKKADVMNKYAYSYNSPAFEIPFIYSIFPSVTMKEQFQELLELQLETTYSEEQCMFDKANEDPETLTARIYELVRFLEL